MPKIAHAETVALLPNFINLNIGGMEIVLHLLVLRPTMLHFWTELGDLGL
jgi:hypothetical protein